MSSDIVLSAALRTNLLSLQNTQSLIDKTQERLSTGLKVNSALDSPQNFFAAQALDNRAGDLGRLLDGIGQSIRVIEEADNGITGLSALIDQADSIATAALAEIRAAEGFAQISGTTDLEALGGNLEDGTIIDDTNSDQFSISVTTFTAAGVATTTALAADVNIATGDTVDDIVAAINSDSNIGANRAGGALIKASVGDGGQLRLESLVEGALVRVTDGSTNTVTAAGFARLGLDSLVTTENAIAATRNGGTAVAGREIKSAVSAVGANATSGLFEASETLGAAGYLNANFATGGADDVIITVTVDGQSTVLGTEYNSADHSIQDVIDDINNAGIDGLTAEFDTQLGQIVLTAADDVGTVGLNFNAEAGGTVSFGFGTGATDQALAGAGNQSSENFTLVGSSANLEQFQSDYNNVRDQIDGLVEDASYQGINLLAGDNLITDFNEDASNRLTTDGVDFTVNGLGIAQGNFTDIASVQSSIDDIFAARQEVRNFGSSIANDLAIIQTRQEFTFQTINTLESGRDDLVVADQNEEGANLLALQTRQALGITALSLASQSQQAVLQLF